MGRITCRCGHWISDNATPAAYKADLVPESASESIDAAVQVKALIQAVQANISIGDFVNFPQRDEEVLDAVLLYKIFGEPLIEASRQVIQCEACGRLLVETNQPNRFQTFLPESDDAHGILAS